MSKRLQEGAAYSSQLFKDSFRGNQSMYGDGNPDFNDGLLSLKGRSTDFVEGVVTRVYPSTYTADVDTDFGTLSACRIGSQHVSPWGGGDSRLPSPGTQCLVCVATESPIILTFMGVPDHTTTASIDDGTSTISSGTNGYGGQDPAYQGGGQNYRQGRSAQLIPEDQVISAPEGNLLAVLRGLTILKGSELSQIIVSSLGGFVRIVSNLYQHMNAAGLVEIYNKDGKSSVSAKFGANVKDNGQVEPTVHIDIGDSGNLFTIAITTEDGENKAVFNVDPQGVLTFSANEVNSVVENDTTLQVNGDVSSDIRGSKEESISGDATEEVGGVKEISADSLLLQTLNNMALKSGGDLSLTVGRRLNLLIAKDMEVRNFGNYTQDIQLSDYTVSVKAGPTSLASMSLTKTGTVAIDATTSMTLKSKTQVTVDGPDVQLGKIGGMPVVRITDLQQLVDILIGHINATGVSAGGKVIVQPGAIIAGAIAQLGSKIVKAI